MVKERLGLFDQSHPKIDIVDLEKEPVVRAEMLGIDCKEVDIEITDHDVWNSPGIWKVTDHIST